LFQVTILFSQELPPAPTDNANWISTITYDISGQTLSKGVGYFNTLGKGTQSLSWDALTEKVWASEVLYDFHGRPSLQTLTAPVNSIGDFSFDNQFILDSTGEYNTADFDATTYFQNNPKSVSTSSKLGSYYWNYSDDPTYKYYDNTNRPYSRTVFSKLNLGSVKKVIGGNKIEGEWKQAYTFTMPAGIELSTSPAFNEVHYANMKITKTVSRDVHGVEAVVFTDSDGNTLAAARSGGDSNRQNVVEIKEQGFVDIHIPEGGSGISLVNTDNIPLRIYDLITENHVAYIGGTTGTQTLTSGFYRIAVRNLEAYPYN
jgi:hypothetical protein